MLGRKREIRHCRQSGGVGYGKCSYNMINLIFITYTHNDLPFLVLLSFTAKLTSYGIPKSLVQLGVCVDPEYPNYCVSCVNFVVFSAQMFVTNLATQSVHNSHIDEERTGTREKRTYVSVKLLHAINLIL